MSDLNELKSKFEIPGAVGVEEGNGGLTKVVLTSNGASGEVYLHGATVTHYQRNGEAPLIFCSTTSPFRTDKAIRGGVPICFPWFGPNADDPKLAQHGFARTSMWNIVGSKGNSDSSVTVILGLKSSASTQSLWANEFDAFYSITVGNSLTLGLSVKNTGSNPFEYQDALHTYFCVSDVRKMQITGLENCEYLDKTDGGSKKKNDSNPMMITGETDRVYLNTTSTCIIHDCGQREISVSKSGSSCTVVWNPWETKAEAMSDLNGGQWTQFICVETVNAADFVVYLKPGETHETVAKIK